MSVPSACRAGAKPNSSPVPIATRRESEHAPIDGHAGQRLDRRDPARHERDEHLRALDREQQTDRGGDHREQHALGEQLPHDPPRRGAERDADRHFALAVRSAREEKIGDVRAGDEEQEADGGEQRPEGALRVADQLLAQRPASAVMFVFDLRHARAGASSAMLSSSRSACSTDAPGLSNPIARRYRPGAVRLAGPKRIGIQRSTASYSPKPGARHADDSVVVLVHAQVPADDTGVATEVLHPDGVAEHHHVRAARLVLVGREDAAERGRAPRIVEDLGAWQFGLVRRSVRRRAPMSATRCSMNAAAAWSDGARSRQARKFPGFTAPLSAYRLLGMREILLAERDDAVGIRIWQAGAAGRR